jgi:hypothetical protein
MKRRKMITTFNPVFFNLFSIVAALKYLSAAKLFLVSFERINSTKPLVLSVVDDVKIDNCDANCPKC